ncbi:MAG: anti-sigma factor domain-containing protein [Solirubrobacteraceae bacterium]
MSGAADETAGCGGEVAAYALGALEPAEAIEFQRHLEQCAICRDELDALRGVVQALPMAAPQYPLPKRLRRRVLRTIREAQPARADLARPRPSRSGLPIALRGRLALGGVATVAAAIAAAVVIATGSGAPSRTRMIQARVAGISGSVQLRVAGDRGELIARHLSPAPAGHIYEVWLKTSRSAPRPASVLFTPGADGGADVGLPESLRGISEVLVTPEPDGGSPAPTHSPVIVAQLA